MIEQIRRKAIGVVSADRAEDQVNLRIGKRSQKICSAILRMRVELLYPVQGMRTESDVQSVFIQPPDADFKLVLHARLAEKTPRQADDANCFYHEIPQFRERF